MSLGFNVMKVEGFLLLSYGVLRIICVFGLQMFTTNMRKHVSAVKVCQDLKPDLKSLFFFLRRIAR